MTSFIYLNSEILLICSFLSPGDHNSLLSACKFLHENMGFNNIVPWGKTCIIKDSEHFNKISMYTGFKHIKDMTIKNSIDIFEMPAFNKLSSLSKLKLCGHNSQIHNIKGINILDKLHTLVIDRYTNMTDISHISNMHNITDLSILDCFRLINFTPLSSMINLNKLSLTCFNKGGLDAISNLINIKNLYINLFSTADISLLSNLKNLI